MKHELSKERLTQAIEQLEHFATNLKWSNVGGAQTLLFAADGLRVLLAAHEQEPDYIRYDCGCCGFETIDEWRDNDVCPKCNHKPLGKTELFTHPAPSIPAAVPEDCPHLLIDFCERVIDSSCAANAKAHELWEACRAAMLQAEHVEAVSSEIPCTWGRYINEACLCPECQPVSKPYKLPDGWIPVSERLPEPNTYVLVSNGVWVGQGSYNDSDHLEDEEHWQDEHHEFINLLHHPVTHWQPLPAAPKV